MDRGNFTAKELIDILFRHKFRFKQDSAGWKVYGDSIIYLHEIDPLDGEDAIVTTKKNDKWADCISKCKYYTEDLVLVD